MCSIQQKSEKRIEQVLPGSRGAGEMRGEVARTMYTHVSKCKNDKVKGERKK
jgi:hypothetical protein